MDEQENVYVADSINSRVEVFDKNGNFLTSFGKAAAAGPPSQAAGPSAFGDPLDLTPGTFNWTAGTNLNNGKLYVSDFFQGRVQVLNVNNTNTTSRSVPESSPVLGLALLGVAAAATTFRKNRLQKLTLSVANEAEKTPV